MTETNPFLDGPSLSDDLLNGRLPSDSAWIAIWFAQYDLKRRKAVADEVKKLGDKVHTLFTHEGHLEGPNKTRNALLGPSPIPPWSGQGLRAFADWYDEKKRDETHALHGFAQQLGEVLDYSVMFWFAVNGRPMDDSTIRRALRGGDLLHEATIAILKIGFERYATKESEMAEKFLEAKAQQLSSYEETAKKVRGEQARKSADARHDKTTRKIKAKALALYRAKEWRSMLQAAKAIKDEVQNYARQLGARLSSERAEKTIYDWIRAVAR